MSRIFFEATSRQSIGVGNIENFYRPKPTPPSIDLLPVYLNDELESLGGRLNNILQGGVFPTVSEMPSRNKEGVCLLFKNEVPNPDWSEGSSEPQYLIPSAGLYIFFGGKWNKISLTPVN